MSVKTSVAMTTYNGAQFVIEQLESIRTQTLPVDEVIIHDDRSKDDTVQLVRDYIEKHNLKTWQIKVNEKNLGFADNFWHTILECRGQLVFLADQDDVWYSNKVESITDFMTTHPDIGCTASAYEVCDAKGDILDMEIRNQWRCNDGGFATVGLDYLMYGRRIIGASMCFRRSLIENEAIFNIGEFGHDTLISFYAVIKTSIVFYSKRLFKYRVHNHNTSSVALKKASIFSFGRIEKNIRWLEDEANVLRELSIHPQLKAFDKILLLDRANFMSARALLVRKLSVKHVLDLLRYFDGYKKTSRHGFFGGCHMFFMDIRFSMAFFKLSKDNAASGKS